MDGKEDEMISILDILCGLYELIVTQALVCGNDDDMLRYQDGKLSYYWCGLVVLVKSPCCVLYIWAHGYFWVWISCTKITCTSSWFRCTGNASFLFNSDKPEWKNEWMNDVVIFDGKVVVVSGMYIRIWKVTNDELLDIDITLPFFCAESSFPTKCKITFHRAHESSLMLKMRQDDV